MADREVEMIMEQVGRKRPDAFEHPLTDLEKAGSGSNREHRSGPHKYSAQGLERYITLSSAVNFSYIVLCSWEAFATTFQFALYNGGPASMVYGSILVSFGATAVATSLAELASIDPTVGAQYRWTAALAPFANRFFGLLQGWITLFAWITACAGAPAIIAQVTTSLVIFNYPTYTPPTHNWQIMLIMWAMILIPFALNLGVRRFLNVFEMMGGILHFLFFLVSIIVLIVLGRRSSNDFVWETLFVDLSGWKNPALNFNIGLLTVTFSVSGFDAVLHMSDEVKKVETRVPRSIIIAAISNSVMLFAFVLVILYCLGDLDTVLNDETGLPLIQVFYLATKSKTGTTILVVLPAIVLFACLFNAYASVSRLAWQFAKDHGLPFSDTLSYVSPKYGVPTNALILVGIICFLLSIIYVGSVTAFNALISLQAMALSISYIMPILFICIRKLRGIPPPYGPFRMGWYGIPTNIFALMYLTYVVIWMPFPTVLPITASYFNYAGPILGAVILLACLDYSISGRKRFKVPVKGKLSEIAMAIEKDAYPQHGTELDDHLPPSGLVTGADANELDGARYRPHELKES